MRASHRGKSLAGEKVWTLKRDTNFGDWIGKGWCEQDFPGRDLWAAVGLTREVDGAYHLPWRECGRKEPRANINCEAASLWFASLEPALRMVSPRYKCDYITLALWIECLMILLIDCFSRFEQSSSFPFLHFFLHRLQDWESRAIKVALVAQVGQSVQLFSIMLLKFTIHF